jgi:hypothetical protein
MTVQFQPGKTTVTQLRVSGSRLDPLITRLRLSSLLAMADLHPTSLPPSSILCIRRLADPLPGALMLDAGGIKPPPDWERAAAAHLDAVVALASRPSQGATPANAEAVIFADHSEMLACLARDWCEGYASKRWWWKGLFPGVDITSAVVPAWLEAPHYLPAALAHLAADGKATLFVRQVKMQDARALLHAVVQAFGLRSMTVAIKDAPSTQTSGPDLSGSLKSESKVAPALYSNEAPPGQQLTKAVPWARSVPESSAGGLGLDQQILLGVGLLLQRAPVVARTQQFAEEVRQWRAEQMALSTPLEEPEASVSKETAILVVPKTGHASSAESSAKREPGRLKWEATGPATVDALPDVQGSPNRMAGERRVGPGEGQAQLQQPAAASLSLPVESAAPPVGSPLLSLRRACVDTQLGGLFYLINIGLFLGLYGDFTMPARPGILLSIWDFIAVLGKDLMAEANEVDEGDPVWTLLAGLAGRNQGDRGDRGDRGDGGGANDAIFEPPGDWRVPVEWLAPFPEYGVWRWSARGGRLRVSHPQGFLVLDLPLADGRPVEQVGRYIAPYREAASHFSLERGAIPGRIRFANPFERWVSRLSAYIRSCSCRALGISLQDDVSGLMLCSRARICVTAGHVDVTFALDKLPIEVRLAGLDRDPGWVPAAGRFVAFHFE